MKPALLVVDMQERFIEKASAEKRLSWEDAISSINPSIQAFRQNGLPVIAVEHMDEEDGLVPGAAGFDTDKRIALLPEDTRIRKEFGSAFGKTELARLLREWGVDAVVVSGYCAEWCVLSTARGAEPEGFKAMILADGIASGHPARIPFILEINESISSGALESFLL
jgi:nicotinamidase-related amidase